MSEPMSEPTDELSTLWKWFAETQCRGYSPLYEAISVAVSQDRQVLELVRASPPSGHIPPALLSAVHYLLLDGLDHPLRDVYAGRSDADPGPLFLEVCHTHAQDVSSILASRHIQTNECGRSAVIAPGLTWLGTQLNGPFALVDVGTSAGLNLLCDRYRIDYGAHGATGPADSPVQITCSVRAGDPPIAERLPSFPVRVGIDRSPIDLTDPDDARWLLACVWPDTGRLERTAASIRFGQSDPPRLVAGDANETLPEVLASLPAGMTALVLTTWAFAYLSLEERETFVELLEAASHERTVAWLSAEGDGIVEAFGDAPVPTHDGTRANVLGVLSFGAGRRSDRLLGFVHQHGNWIDWRDPAPLTP